MVAARTNLECLSDKYVSSQPELGASTAFPLPKACLYHTVEPGVSNRRCTVPGILQEGRLREYIEQDETNISKDKCFRLILLSKIWKGSVDTLMKMEYTHQLKETLKYQKLLDYRIVINGAVITCKKHWGLVS